MEPESIPQLLFSLYLDGGDLGPMEAYVRTSVVSGRVDLVDCIRSGLALTGEAGASVIEYHLATRLKVKIADAPKNPEKLVEGLFAMFGEGAKPIFLSILRELLLCSYHGVEFSPLASALTRALHSEPPPPMYLSTPAASDGF